MDKVAGLGAVRERAAGAGSEVLQEFNAGALGRAQTGDAHAGAEDEIEVLLLGSEVLAFAGDAKAEGVAVIA